MNRWNLLADLFRSPKSFPKDVQLGAVQQHATACGNVSELAAAALGSIPRSTRCILLATPLHGVAEFQQCRQLISHGLLTAHCNAVCVERPWQPPGGSSTRRQGPATEQQLAGQCIAEAAEAKRGQQQPLLIPLDLFAHCASSDNMLAHLRALDPSLDVPAGAIRGRDAYAVAAAGLPSGTAPKMQLNLHPDVAAALAGRLAVDAVRHVEAMAGAQSAGSNGKHSGSRLPQEILGGWHRLAEAEAEQYFSQLLQPGAKAWSMRQRHMMQVLQSVTSYLEGASSIGQPPGVVVWGHSSSLGDARSCEIGWRRGQVNLGQLLKEQLPGEGALFRIALSANAGSVLAGGSQPAGASRPLQLQPGLAGSYEEVFHSSGLPLFALPLQEPRVREVLEFPMQTRVAAEEFWAQSGKEQGGCGYYYDASLPNQFDLLLHVDVVRATAN